MAGKKIKKFLKKVAPLLAVGLGAAALGKRKKRADSIAANEAKEFGFGQMKLKDFGPYTINRRKTFAPESPLITDDGFITESNPYGEGAAKKGGRMVKTKSGGGAVKKRINNSSGKALRGYGKAYLKGKK